MNLSILAPALALALTVQAAAVKPGPYTTTARGSIAGYRLAGVEPDGDPLYQAVMNTTISPSAGVPRLHLIIDTYMEQFKPDTLPILPDLLHPKQNAKNLGAFLQGKVLLTDDAGNVVSVGSFVSEAFLDNSNNAIMTMVGGKGGYGARGRISGIYNLRKISNRAVDVSGRFTGRLTLSPAARRAVLRNAGRKMRPIEEIIKQVTVIPHAMVGRAVSRSRSVPLRTGFNGAKGRATATVTAPTPPTAAPDSRRAIGLFTIAAAAGAVASFILAGILFWLGRKPPAGEQA